MSTHHNPRQGFWSCERRIHSSFHLHNSFHCTRGYQTIMQFALTADLRHFFEKHRWIEFEGLLSIQESAQLKQEADKTLNERFATQTENRFLSGRDLWRDNPKIKKILFRRNISELASTLFNARPLRIAYDQYFPSSWEPPGPYSLQMTCCLQKLSGALLLQLTESKGLFFLPDLAIPPIKGPSILIAYCPLKTLYVEEK